MKKIKGFVPNQYIADTRNTIFTVLLKHAMLENKSLQDLKKKSYVHGLLKYPPRWSKSTDIFKFIDKRAIKSMRKKETFFIFDASTEGFCPIDEIPFFDMLYYNCHIYNIDPQMVMYVSANLKDEDNIEYYAKTHNVKPMKVFSFPSFEQVLAVDNNKAEEVVEIQYQKALEGCKNDHNDKFFSSLSRINREYRTLATFMLCQDSIASRGLISHDKVRNWNSIAAHPQLSEYTSKQAKKWIKSLPRVVDRNDFGNNWAINTPYDQIFNKTLFQIVNETSVNDFNNKSLFYSEKSFRPIGQFQPFVLYSQRNANQALQTLGYKTYDGWFDLSFDSISDPIERYKELLKSVKETVKHLESMSKEQRVEWRFKDPQLLKHNFNIMISSERSKQKLLMFMESLCT